MPAHQRPLRPFKEREERHAQGRVPARFSWTGHGLSTRPFPCGPAGQSPEGKARPREKAGGGKREKSGRGCRECTRIRGEWTHGRCHPSKPFAAIRVHPRLKPLSLNHASLLPLNPGTVVPSGDCPDAKPVVSAQASAPSGPPVPIASSASSLRTRRNGGRGGWDVARAAPVVKRVVMPGKRQSVPGCPEGEARPDVQSFSGAEKSSPS